MWIGLIWFRTGACYLLKFMYTVLFQWLLGSFTTATINISLLKPSGNFTYDHV
jgi:hypothetical protein